MRVRSLVVSAAAAVAVLAVGVVGAVMGPAPATPVHGPLAAAPSSELARAGHTVTRTVTGALRHVDGCVLLDPDDDAARPGEALLVWPAERTRWHPSLQLITVDRPGGGVVILELGDRVRIAGAESLAGAGGPAAEEWAAEVAWTSPPADGCVGQRRLWVTDVTGA